MIPEAIYSEYLRHLLDGDRHRCRQLVLDLIADEVGARDLYVNLFQRSLYEIGTLWETNRVSVATEHMATAITEGLLALIYPTLFRAEHKDRSAVVACAANEYHQVGGRMVADIFEMHGWHGYFVGANAPVPDLLKLIGEKQPSIVGLSLTISSNLPRLATAIESIRDHFPDLTLLVGGQALQQVHDELCRRFPAVRYIADLGELDRLIEQEY